MSLIDPHRKSIVRCKILDETNRGTHKFDRAVIRPADEKHLPVALLEQLRRQRRRADLSRP